MRHSILCVVITISACPASAATTFYTDTSAFNMDVVAQHDPTGMSNATTQAEADALTSDGEAIKAASSGVPGNITFDGLSVGGIATSAWGAAHGFNANATFGVSGIGYTVGNPFNEDHIWNFTSGTKAFGFDIYDAADAAECSATICYVSDFRLEAFDMFSNSLGFFVSPGNYGGLAFVGVSSDALIGRLEVTELTPGPVISSYPYADNEIFGNYRTGTLASETASPVPLPASLPIFVAGLGMLMTVRRKKAA